MIGTGWGCAPRYPFPVGGHLVHAVERLVDSVTAPLQTGGDQDDDRADDGEGDPQRGERDGISTDR